VVVAEGLVILRLEFGVERLEGFNCGPLLVVLLLELDLVLEHAQGFGVVLGVALDLQLGDVDGAGEVLRRRVGFGFLGRWFVFVLFDGLGEFQAGLDAGGGVVGVGVPGHAGVGLLVGAVLWFFDHGIYVNIYRGEIFWLSVWSGGRGDQNY
jgi:hypothetical protein